MERGGRKGSGKRARGGQAFLYVGIHSGRAYLCPVLTSSWTGPRAKAKKGYFCRQQNKIRDCHKKPGAATTEPNYLSRQQDVWEVSRGEEGNSVFYMRSVLLHIQRSSGGTDASRFDRLTQHRAGCQSDQVARTQFISPFSRSLLAVTTPACLLYSQLGFLGSAVHTLSFVGLLGHGQVGQAGGHDAARLRTGYLYIARGSQSVLSPSLEWIQEESPMSPH